MLLAKNLTKSYKEVQALSQVNLSIKKGELYGMLGPNGAVLTSISVISFKRNLLKMV